MGGPITFQLDGEQYIATLAGLGGVAMAERSRRRTAAQRIWSRGRVQDRRQSELPALQATVSRVIPDLRRANATGDAEAGSATTIACARRVTARTRRSVTSVPDLRYSPAIADAATFKSIVIDGARAAERNGGIRFRADAADAEAFAPVWCTWRWLRRRRGERSAGLTHTSVCRLQWIRIRTDTGR
jgi:hypothetical protein